MKISVVVTAYNHQKYISQCIDSILMQQGNFELEVIVGDDNSSDRTREILENFENRYPKTIMLLPKTSNMGLPANLKRCLSRCTGNYIAVCEGDDYWLEPRKLSAQVEFLQSNPECSMCFHGVMLFYEDKNEIIKHFAHEKLLKTKISAEDLILINHIGNFSCCMYRTDIIKQLPARLFNQRMADWLFNISCAQFGPAGFIPEFLSVYRIHSSSSWSSKNRKQQIKSVLKIIPQYDEFLGYKYTDAFFEKENTLKLELSNLRKNSLSKWTASNPIWRAIIKIIRNEVV